MKINLNKAILLITLMFTISISSSDAIKDIKLPVPLKNSSVSLMEALTNRQSSRDFSNKEISKQTISNLLWSAYGINREKSEKRTAPSSYNWQDIIIYVFTQAGVWTYDAKNNTLVGVKSGDCRSSAGMQGYVKTAPLSLVYVSDSAKMFKEGKKFSDQYKLLMGCIDAGHVSQNVYLYCSIAGLNVVARASVDKESFKKEFKLPETYNVILGQTVGYSNK